LGFYVKELIFLIGKQRNFINSVKAPLSIHQVYKKYTKTEKERTNKKKKKKKKKRKEKKPAKPKNRRKPKHPNRNQPTKPREQYIIPRALLCKGTYGMGFLL